MSSLSTLLWLEFKRSAWVIYGALIGLVVFALVLISLPGVMTGLDVLNLPLSSFIDEDPGQSDCVTPDCESPGRSQVQMARETSGGASSFNWSFSRTWGGSTDSDEEEPGPGRADPQDALHPSNESSSDPSVVSIPVPEELQVAVRPRQLATVATTLGLTALVLLGFWIAYSREADRGEMVLLYQSPVSGETQLLLRFFFVSATSALAMILVIAIYWGVQVSQAYAPLAPIAEALGARAQLHWGSLFLSVLATQVFPNAAFLVLFIQLQNAYDLLGGKRLASFVLVLAAMVLSLRSLLQEADVGEPAGAVLHVLSIVSNPTLDNAVSNFSPSQYRIDVSLEVIVIGTAVSALMLFLAGRIWREVEWS
jgi:hypothetical protein